MSQVGAHLIRKDDLIYEQQLIKDPNDLSIWLKYYRNKSGLSDCKFIEKVFILQRAVTELPRSYKLWMMYLKLRINYIKDINYSRNVDQFKQVNELFDKSLVLLHKFPLVWVEYLKFLNLQPDITLIRRKFNESLRALPVIQHGKIWPLYLEFGDRIGGLVGINTYLKYLQFQPDDIESIIEKLIKFGDFENSSKLFEQILTDGTFISSSKSPLELWLEYSDLLIDQIKNYKKMNLNLSQFDRFFEKFIKNGLRRFPDQVGRLYVKHASFHIRRKNYEQARAIFEEGLIRSLTIKDFIIIFDTYSEFEEQLITKLIAKIKDLEEEDKPIDEDLSVDLDLRMLRFERLMDERPFLLNDVVLRQNINNVDEWLNRIALYTEDQIEDVLKTYVKAITSIDPLKTRNLHRLWVNYAKVYEENDDLSTARSIFDKAIKVPFKDANELVEIWLEWAEMELRHDDIEQALKVIEAAVKIPADSSKIDFFEETIPAQGRIHKSIKLWSFYLDLIESSGSIKETSDVYDKVFDLKIATPLTVINYANFLEENNFFEESFKVYERGISIFPYPTVFEIWNIYLMKAMARKVSLERMRDLFEQSLEKCPPNLSKAIYLLYARFEEDKGLIQRSLRIYKRSLENIENDQKAEVYKIYIDKTIDLSGLASARPIYEQAIESASITDSIDFCVDFCNLEVELGDYERARAVLHHGARLLPVDKNAKIWTKWSEFELKHGNESTYKDMLRVKREVANEFESKLQATRDRVLEGFVKGSSSIRPTSNSAGVNSSKITTEENPDAIGLDLDMDDSD